MQFFTSALLVGLAAAGPVVERATGFPARPPIPAPAPRPVPQPAPRPAPAPVPSNNSPQGAKITSVQYAGSGCPNNAAPNVNYYGSVVNVSFSSFAAIFTAQNTFLQQQERCDLTISLNSPAGWAFSVETITYVGSVNLPTPQPDTNGNAVCTANLTTDYTMTGVPMTAGYGGVYNFTSPQAGNFQRVAQLAQAWSPCSTGNSRQAPTFDIATEIAAACLGDPGTAGAGIQLYKENVEVQAYINANLIWRRC